MTEDSKPSSWNILQLKAFNTNGIVYDNTPWRPGRGMDSVEKQSEDDERRLKNLATRIMSNGVEVLVKDKNSDGKHEQTKYMEVKTIQPSAATNMYMSSYPKIDKRIDSDENDNFELIQPSEVSKVPCTSSCSCSNIKTESLKTKYTESASLSKYGMKSTKYGDIDLKPTNKESPEKKTQYEPYEFESNSNAAPTDKVVEKYTEVINDYSDEKESNSVEQSELLTNEQAPVTQKTNKVNTKVPEKSKPEKTQKPNKNKFVVADLLKLGSLGIKGLTQLAPVLEKMTGGFIRRHENVNKTTTTTIKPAEKIIAYNANKRVDNDMDGKKYNFPIYIPVDEMETSESQLTFTNATLHQNLAWAAEHKHPKAHIVLPKVVHESPLVNGGIPISPGEIITANSDVIVGKPAVGGPLTLAASGIKLQNSVNPPPLDSLIAANEQYFVNEEPLSDQPLISTKVDDSFDLRPPEPPKSKNKLNRPTYRPGSSFYKQNIPPNDQYPYRMPSTKHDHLMKTEQITPTGTTLGNHGRPVFLDYIPSLVKPSNIQAEHYIDLNNFTGPSPEIEVADSNPSSSEIVHSQIRADDDKANLGHNESSKPFLVDIQPSRVANVLIPHGSSTALVFAGSSEPHKTGDYIDDPLPYPEPGYFGSFSIDAPQMTNVHNVAPSSNKHFIGQSNLENFKEQSLRNDLKIKWKEMKRPLDFGNIPPPTSNQETHVQVGPQITVYDPEVYSPTNSDFQKFNQVRGKDKTNDGKDIIDKDYENYLAVPPPPQPSSQHYNKDIYDKSKPYSQRPIVHTKPVQDMKVFLNIQHPVPDQLPPKVTSEIYFASQIPNNKPTPTYTIRIPPSSFTNFNHQSQHNLQPPKTMKGVQHFGNDQNFQNNNAMHNSLNFISSANIANQSPTPQNSDDKNTYTVTLNTATNVASNNEAAQVIGSSVPVAVGALTNSDQLNTDIPIKTNFAIKVEDNTAPLESYNLQQEKVRNPYIVHSQHDQMAHNNSITQISVGDNRWNKSSTDTIKTTISGSNYYNQNYGDKVNKNSVSPSINSHANFPMINGDTTPSSANEDVKLVTNYADNIKSADVKRTKLIPNIPTNSHGWYSSVFTGNNVNNINLEVTTRKVIPLIRDYHDKNKNPHFGQKIASVGKPPTEFLSQNAESVYNFPIGKPFTKPQTTEKSIPTSPPFTTKPFHINYIPSNFDGVKQPAYDIPIHDNSDEMTTMKTKLPLEKEKPVYENSEEIYDGEDETEHLGDSDGEISSESMKVPVVSSSKEIDNISMPLTEITLLQDEVFSSQSIQKDKNDNKMLVNFNPGTQTEKPFGSYNQSTFQSNTVKPIYDHPNNNVYMKPRPFAINTAMVLDHQLQQPHWQINHMVENSTNVSYEDTMDLNIGEKIERQSDKTSTLKPVYSAESETKYKRNRRPNLGTRLNSTHLHNESIITSTVQIQNKKPLVVEKVTEKTTLPTFTLPNLELNRSSSEIIDLSPPPPTMNYSFKPSTNDEMIMGMSPPPPRTPPGIRIPTRIPLTPRPGSPSRTPPSYWTKSPRPIPSRMTTQRPLRKPGNRDEISTYRPYFDLNGIRRPTFNRDQPSSQLLPPPREVSTRVVNPMNELPSSTISVPNVVFPTPVSSGWLTSSGIEFSSSFNFAPTPIQFPENSEPSKITDSKEETSLESNYSYESSFEHSDESSSETSVTDQVNISSESSPESISTSLNTANISTIPDDKNNLRDSSHKWSSKEEVTTDKIKVVPLANKNRNRKPYPTERDEKRNSTNKVQSSTKTALTIKPTKTLSRPDILYPTRTVSIKKIIRPISRPPAIIAPSVIESSEQALDEKLMKPTEVLKDTVISSITQVEITRLEEPKLSNLPTPIIEDVTTIKPTHHAGNEIKISDEIIPTKTEFRTAIVTLTKTLSEPPRTVSSVGYVNLTHTLTITHTKTSLVSQSEGAFTQTLVLTNTHTSTIVDVVTKVHTQVQPTTIIETVTKHIPVPQVQPTSVQAIVPKTKIQLDDISMSSEENENLIIRDSDTTDNIIQKIENESDNDTDNDTFFVVLNKSQNGGQSPAVNADLETSDYDVTRNEQVNSNGVSQVLFGEILLAGTPYLETTNVNPIGGYGKECQPDCKASRNERCQRIDGLMKCICRPGFARMFPDRPCKPTYTYSVKLALGSQGNKRLEYHEYLSDNSSKLYHALALATHEGINRMVMQSDLRDVYHGVHITGFHPVELKSPSGELYQGVMNDFYVQLSDNAHESRLKEVIEKYLRHNNYSLGGTDVHAARELMDKLNVSDFDECLSGQFHDCSEHAQCFNLRGTYTCSCLEGFADLSVNTLYPGRICSAEPVGCERCNYHGACYSRDDRRILCECFQWYSGSSCQINLKVVLISLVVCGALLSAVLAVCAVLACSRRTRRPPHPQRSIVACIQSMPSLHQGAMPKQRADRRALISERGETGDASSLHNASLPYMPAKQHRSSTSKKCVISDPPAHDPPPPPPGPAVMIPRARLHAHHGDSRENISRKRSLELSSEAKLISYLESGAVNNNDEMRRKHSLESSYSANKDRHNKQGALVSAGFKVSTTIRPDETVMKSERDDLSSVNKGDLEAELSHFDTLRKTYSQEDLSEWTDAERRLGELTLSEARSVGGTLPASTGRAASSTRLTHQEANTMAERDLGSTFLLPHVHLYKPDLTSDVSEFDSL
ncbi:unnamed protein product [Arctia plantaginis]|uniref:EGF-like domain-containing protein n=1 Tax=Arctia plantaginis TaxID=874455 RepID=A0A8S1A7U3_ARCPL|nr:unnamed protein product [Arctia plantaginis]CAB3242685.1 unnamed protein product [Arctia plantaginis]